jgi:hypothetical protein
VHLALAASISLIVAGTWMSGPEAPAGDEAAEPGSWSITAVRGEPRLGASTITAQASMASEEWLETDAASSAKLRAGDVGLIEVGPKSRLRLVNSARGEHRLALERGSLDAFIWASPGRFLVETPSAVAVDLGCAYRLEVDDTGAALLRVTAGWVGFRLDGRDSLVPHGAVCRTRPGRGPGTPHFEDAAPSFVAALAAIDASDSLESESLHTLLRESRARDALSLWHLLSRLDPPAVSQVYDRLAALEPAPARVSKEKILSRDRAALDAWWDSLGYGPASQFRMWMER